MKVQNIIKLLILVSVVALSSCSNGGGSSSSSGSSPAPVTPPDFVTYQLSPLIACGGNQCQTRYATAYFNNNIGQLVIRGTQYTLTFQGRGCTSTETGYTSNDTVSYTTTSRLVVNRPAGNCNVDFTLTSGTSSYFDPASWTRVISEGPKSSFTGDYFETSNTRNYITTETSASGHRVYMSYIKQ